MSPTVLLDGRLILDKPTGIGRYFTSLLPQLFREAPDWRFHLLRQENLWPGYSAEVLTVPNVVHHFTSMPHMTLRQHVTIPRLAQRLGADLVHYPHFDAPVLRGTVPVVATVHDTKYLTYSGFFDKLSQPKLAYMRFCFRQTVRRASAVIAVSNHTREDLIRLFDPDPWRLHTIYEAPDPRYLPVDSLTSASVTNRLGLRRPFILSVGERRPHKNFVRLIAAFAQSMVVKTHQLVIVGHKYHTYDEPEEEAQRLDVRNRVHFLQDVDEDDLVALYSAADLFVLVSLYEGFGLPVLEAMACGTPVIASATTATGEILGNGGIPVDPRSTASIKEAIDAVIDSAQTRKKLVRLGRNRAAQFSWQRAARETIAVYESALNARS